ncbi:helix-turn-helix domain-containing protein [Breznakia pachnodae]|uniref:Transcriptional regulator with XRE-family HTH domain n=1 Tax=Breznakia pachnodae TaxID=265178 RepID=A0ABU0E3N4_9FIRM|nr:helix-turn-helix transcriptional regulator [Breznakia pachnodae]MDQ0361499.1 transcriptional regulator with XRE-family HTH domain [Breznakia pachnodae]
MKYSDLNYEDIGNRIKTFRKEKNLTQQKLADIVDIVTSNVSHIERGTTKVSLPTLVKIANALEVTVDEILCGNVKQAAPLIKKDIAKLLDDCNPKELKILTDILVASKKTIRDNH